MKVKCPIKLARSQAININRSLIILPHWFQIRLKYIILSITYESYNTSRFPSHHRDTAHASAYLETSDLHDSTFSQSRALLHCVIARISINLSRDNKRSVYNDVTPLSQEGIFPTQKLESYIIKFKDKFQRSGGIHGAGRTRPHMQTHGDRIRKFAREMKSRTRNRKRAQSVPSRISPRTCPHRDLKCSSRCSGDLPMLSFPESKRR